jgi:predicted metal-dependent HD superfamily phosphohydrolase
MTPVNDALKEELSLIYNTTNRYYHNLSHITALLALLEKYRALFADPEAIEAVIWFHDAVYDPRAKDNEQKSAELAVTRLSASVTAECMSAERLSRIRTIIEATATHIVPECSNISDKADAEMFLDMDLSILGAKEDVFDAYESAVRKEYSWASDAAWCKGRATVLTAFLNREKIFYSDIFREQYENRARQNITRSLSRLGVKK